MPTPIIGGFTAIPGAAYTRNIGCGNLNTACRINGLGGGLGFAIVSFHHHVTAGQQFPLFTDRQRIAF